MDTALHCHKYGMVRCKWYIVWHHIQLDICLLMWFLLENVANELLSSEFQAGIQYRLEGMTTLCQLSANRNSNGFV